MPRAAFDERHGSIAGAAPFQPYDAEVPEACGQACFRDLVDAKRALAVPVHWPQPRFYPHTAATATARGKAGEPVQPGRSLLYKDSIFGYSSFHTIC